MAVHLLGGVWSPSCANYALQHTVINHRGTAEPQVIEAVLCSFYLDDILSSMKSEEKATQLGLGLKKLLTRGGFKLTKWMSNQQQVLESITLVN